MKLSVYAKKIGVCYQTAWNLYSKNQIPGAYKLPSGTIIVPEDNLYNHKKNVVIYCRVSNQLLIPQSMLTNHLFLLFRLKEVLFSKEQLYLVFEYLEFDLKKYMKKVGKALPPQ